MHTNYEREIPLRMATVVGNAMTEFYLINDGNARRAAGAGSSSGAIPEFSLHQERGRTIVILTNVKQS